MTVVKTFSNVTVEATPKIAEEIAVAQTIGELSL
jgi:pilus assembly protein CpaB